ncbi:MAG: hypothetical protein JXB23_07085 [Candidatus Aminicenantes bacterium]|nr:hypothetical protein [Candidatus Aminicenantes bacterium]
MKKAGFWILAFMITLSAAVYQRLTGPTYPLRGKITLAGTEISYRLIRTHEIGPDCNVKVKVPVETIRGRLIYKRYKTDDPWTSVPMERDNGFLSGKLPQQPSAGKLAYNVFLSDKDEEIALSTENPIIIRFKGFVPRYILIPHIIIMFLAMLFSTRAGLEALRKRGSPRKLVIWTLGLLVVGGMIFGPLVQKFAFGSLWTGFPFGYDLTDNKTLIALLGWIAAWIAGRKGKPARVWVLGASILMLVVFLIPHSLLGSELDYSKIDVAGR